MLERSCPEPELCPEVSNRRPQSTHTRIPLGKLWEAWAQLHPPKWTLGAAKYAGQKVLSGQAENQQLANSTGYLWCYKKENKSTRRTEPWLCGPRTSCWAMTAWGFLEDILPVKFFFFNFWKLWMFTCLKNRTKSREKKETLKLKICFPSPQKRKPYVRQQRKHTENSLVPGSFITS